MRINLIICAALLFLITPAYADYQASVVGITDGDSITVLTTELRQVKIRLYGVDAPEKKQDFGSVAKQAASYLAFGKTVTILPRSTDHWGRSVAEVILPDGHSLNEEMVYAGMAWWYQRYAPHDVNLQNAETMARGEKIGLWIHPNPTPPWEYRKQRRRSQWPQ